MAARVVGLDLGTYAVRAVELSLGGGQPTLERFAQLTLPPGAVRDGEVVDPGAVSSTIRRLWSEGGFKGRQVVAGVANQRVIVRLAEMPAMREDDLRAALRFEAQELIPIPVEDAILDFQILEELTGHEGDARMQVLLAAAQRDMVRTHLAAIDGAGLRARSVDVVPFALVRSATLAARAFDDDTRAEAIVCIGGGVTNVVVHENGIPRFVRVLLVGGDDVTEAIAAGLDVGLEDAESLKRRADSSSADPAAARAGRIVSDRLAPLVEEIRGSLDYYVAQSQSSTIDRVLVTGGGSRIPGLMERLQAQLGAQVLPARPLDGLRIGSGLGFSAEQLEDLSPLLSVPIGLALAGDGKGPRRINLLPREVSEGREERRQVVMAGMGVAALVAVLLGVWGSSASKVTAEKTRTETAQARVTSLRAEEASLGDTFALDAELASRRAQVQTALTNDVAWTRMFNEVATVLPNDVWLTAFSGGDGTVNFSAKGFDHTSTANWLIRAGQIKQFDGLWVPTSTKQGEGAQSTVDFTSDANLTAAANSDRTKRYLEEQQ